jgi:hypothetical protein
LAIGFALVLALVFAAAPVAAQESGALIIEARDQAGALIPGGCYTVSGDAGLFGPFCDDDADGQIELVEVPPGEWTVWEDFGPKGYQLAGDASQVVFVDPGATVVVVFAHVPIEQEGDLGDLVIEAEARPADPPYQPVEVTPPVRLNLTPTCAGLRATIVGATSASGVPTKIVGTNGDDVIVGTAGPDLISGLGGQDTICSLDGNDVVGGGDGDDTLAGGAGVDHLDGGPGKRDACDGGTGSDVAIGCESTTTIP